MFRWLGQSIYKTTGIVRFSQHAVVLTYQQALIVSSPHNVKDSGSDVYILVPYTKEILSLIDHSCI